MDEDNKPSSQVSQSQEVSLTGGVVKCPSGGRPSIEEDLELQREYAEIYRARIIDGMSEEEVALARAISRGKVKNAVQWCRIGNTGCSAAEELVDAGIRLDYRLKALLNEQGRLLKWLGVEYKALDILPAAAIPQFSQLKRIECLSRLFLMYEDRVQLVLREKFAVRRLLGNFMPPDGHSLNPMIQKVTEFTDNMNDSGLTNEERVTIAEILGRHAKGPE